MFGLAGIFLLIFAIPFLAVYFVPTIIALARHDKNAVGIILLNIFAGWTFLGWVGALVWSVVDQRQ